MGGIEGIAVGEGSKGKEQHHRTIYNYMIPDGGSESFGSLKDLLK